MSSLLQAKIVTQQHIGVCMSALLSSSSYVGMQGGMYLADE